MLLTLHNKETHNLLGEALPADLLRTLTSSAALWSSSPIHKHNKYAYSEQMMQLPLVLAVGNKLNLCGIVTERLDPG